MRTFKAITLTVLLSLTAVRSYAAPYDVTSPNSSKFIKITESGNKRKFELCQVKSKKCELLGERIYNIKELKELHSKLAWQLSASSAVSILGVACAVGGIIAGASAVAGAGLFAAGTDLAAVGLGATLIGGSVGGAALAITSKYNPISIYGRMNSVNKNVIEDIDVSIKGGTVSIEEFAQDLDQALKEI